MPDYKNPENLAPYESMNTVGHWKETPIWMFWKPSYRRMWTYYYMHSCVGIQIDNTWEYKYD